MSQAGLGHAAAGHHAAARPRQDRFHQEGSWDERLEQQVSETRLILRPGQKIFENVHLRRQLVCRESLFLLTYLLFLINTVVGLIAAIWRMVITALYNILHLGRIDISLLHRSAEAYDPGSSRVVSCSHKQA